MGQQINCPTCFCMQCKCKEYFETMDSQQIGQFLIFISLIDIFSHHKPHVLNIEKNTRKRRAQSYMRHGSTAQQYWIQKPYSRSAKHITEMFNIRRTAIFQYLSFHSLVKINKYPTRPSSCNCVQVDNVCLCIWIRTIHSYVARKSFTGRVNANT